MKNSQIIQSCENCKKRVGMYCPTNKESISFADWCLKWKKL